MSVPRQVTWMQRLMQVAFARALWSFIVLLLLEHPADDGKTTMRLRAWSAFPAEWGRPNVSRS